MIKYEKIVLIMVIIFIAVVGVGGYAIYKLNDKIDEQNNAIFNLSNGIEKNNVNESNLNNIESNNLTSQTNSANITATNYANLLSIETKLKMVYTLDYLEKEKESTSGPSDEDIILLLIRYVSLKSLEPCTDQTIIDEYNLKHSCEIFEFSENDIKKAAKDIFGINISNGVNKYEDFRLKYYNGKYYFHDCPADGTQLTIRYISNKGDTYTFFALNALHSDIADDSEFSKYEATIVDGVIKSWRAL